MPLTLRTHVTERVPGTLEQSRVVRTAHYVRIAAEGNPPLYIQGGAVYSEGGGLVDEIPDWFWPEVNRLTPAALATVQYEVPNDKRFFSSTAEVMISRKKRVV